MLMANGLESNFYIDSGIFVKLNKNGEDEVSGYVVSSNSKNVVLAQANPLKNPLKYFLTKKNYRLSKFDNYEVTSKRW